MWHCVWVGGLWCALLPGMRSHDFYPPPTSNFDSDSRTYWTPTPNSYSDSLTYSNPTFDSNSEPWTNSIPTPSPDQKLEKNTTPTFDSDSGFQTFSNLKVEKTTSPCNYYSRLRPQLLNLFDLDSNTWKLTTPFNSNSRLWLRLTYFFLWTCQWYFMTLFSIDISLRWIFYLIYNFVID